MIDTKTTLDLDGWTGAAQAIDTFTEKWTAAPVIHSTFGDDTVRTRKSDPVTSHRAGDKSAESLTVVKRAVIALVRAKGTLTGSQANIMYRDLAQYPANGLPLVAWDSPRKRLGELAAAGDLVVVNEDSPRGTEREYALPTETKEEAA